MAALMAPCAGAQALDKVDGVYQIATPQDMVDFAALVADGEPDANAVLTADIDISDYHTLQIGAPTVPYTGTFDGQYHTLTIDAATDGEYCSLFRMLAGTVRCLNVRGNVSAQAKYASALVGEARDCTIENCITEATIYSTLVGDGTFGGIVGLVADNCHATVKNTCFAGAIVAESTTSCGGICGWSSGTITIDHCMVIADVSQTSSSECNTFSRNPGNATIIGGAYLNAYGTVPAGVDQLEASQLSSGEACFIVNGMSSESPVWFQNLGEDPIPVPNPSHATVYASGRIHCNGDVYEGTVYQNTPGTIQQDDHDWLHGKCNYCSLVDEAYKQPAADGFYELASADDLLWFAALVNSDVKPDANARLTAPVSLEGIDWPSIGRADIVYKGTFDGGLQPITGLNAILFGSANGATFRNIAIEEATIVGRDASRAAHSGSIVGVALNSQMTGCYSKASLTLGDEGDLGGLAGKFTGTISNCAFYGTLTSAGWSEGGISGSGEAAAITIEDCVVWADLITTGGQAKGTLLGWNDNATITNCFTVETPEGFDGFSGNMSTAKDDSRMVTSEVMASGEVAWELNKQNFVDAKWYQTLDEDEAPVLLPTHAVVYQLSGGYTNNQEEMRDAILVEAGDYINTVVACQADIDAFAAAMEAVAAATSSEAFNQAYTAFREARAVLEKSAQAYATYQQTIDDIIAYVDEHYDELAGPLMDVLESYLYDDVEPGADGFPNGSYGYIIENCALTAEQITEEIAFADQLLGDAVRGGFSVGSEVTKLVANANLDDAENFKGWETTSQGSTFTVLRENGITYTAEGWNATFDLHQTLTGLPNGVYELRANSVFRAANNDYDGNDNYSAFLYAGNNAVNVMTAGEDLIPSAEAINMENSYIEGSGNVDKLYEDGEVEGYYPVGPVGCYYAFGAGRYQNRIACTVTDGTLIIGLKNLGTGQANDWCGFDNFQLFYLGTEEEAAEALAPTLEGMAARARTLLRYVADSGENYRVRPNFSADLRDRLQQAIDAVETTTDGSEKMRLVETFSQLFQEVYVCKKAYIALENAVEALLAAVYDNPDATDDEKAEIEALVPTVMEKWETGAYTTEEALAQSELKATQFYQRFFSGAPEQVDGVYQLATVDDLLWFSRLNNNVPMNDLKGVLTAPVDLTDVEWEPIGTPGKPFQGTFDGRLQPITGLTKGLFGTVNNATIEGVAIVGGSITGDAAYAAHTASLVGMSYGNTTLNRCFSSASIVGGTGDGGGLVGKMAGYGTMRNCYFAGNITYGWSAGCLMGSSDGTTIAEVSDCYVDARGVTYGNGDAHGLVVGWLHDGQTDRFSDVYLIAAPSLTNVMGWTDNATAAKANCPIVDVETFKSGEIAYMLNHGNEDNPVWFQTLGTDETPVLASSHEIVILKEDGTYANKQGSAIDKLEMEQRLPAVVNVYGIDGRLVRTGVARADALRGLPAGIYVIGGKKVANR